MALKILLIEDDFVLAEGLVENLNELGYTEVKVASRYSEVKTRLKDFEPDVFVVDIYLKGSAKNGIEIMEEVNSDGTIPLIYLTSFDDHTYRDKAKNTSPSAYLIKPASKQQIDVAIDFAISNFSKSEVADPGSPEVLRESLNLHAGLGYFFVKTSDRYEKISENDVLYFKASGTYTVLYTTAKTYTLATNIKRVLPQLNQNIFIRCHRSFAVNKNKIAAFDDANIFVKGPDEMNSIPISRSFKSDISSSLVKIKTE